MKPRISTVFAGMFVLLAAAGFIFPAPAARAQEASSTPGASSAAPVSVEDCGITTADLAAVTAIQNDPSLSYEQEVQAELTARKNLVGGLIGCAQSQAVTLRSALASTTAPSDMQNLQNQLSGNLNDAVNFYNIELAKLDGAGIAGSAAIAKEVLAWRQGTYAPLAGEVNNFILWSTNQNLFDTAQNRLAQTARAVSFLLNAAPNDDLQGAFSAASASFRTAQSANASAKAALLQSLPAGQSLALIQQSLAALSDTYQKFFDVSTLITSLLPQ